ncbi:MAG: IS66 family transposase [Thermoplasmatota archaeon]
MSPDSETEKEKKLREENARLRKRLKDLEKENKDLRDQLAHVRGSAPMLAASDRTAEAGGVPSSKVFYRRSRNSKDGRPSGGQPGHEGHARRRPTPNEPPAIQLLSKCPACEGDLGPPRDFIARTITDIPDPQIRVYEIHTYRYQCRGCHARVQAAPLLPPNQQFGPNVAAHIAHERMLGRSMTKVVATLEETYGLVMSEATAYSLESWVADVLGPTYEELKAKVLKAPRVGGDETKFRVNGENGWLWVITSALETVYGIYPTRGKHAILDLLPEYEGTITRDAWDPYDQLTNATHQLDLLHVNRWLERAEVLHGIEPRKLVKDEPIVFTRRGRPPKELLTFIDGIRARLREAILFPDLKPTLPERAGAYERFTGSMRRFLARPWTDPDAIRIGKEMTRRVDTLYTFVRIPGVDWHNNSAERDIRQGVLHRKISGGRRTWAGAKILETLMSVYETCKKTGQNFLGVARNLLAGDSPLSTGWPQS